jgi:hypothetical protein
MADIVAGLRGAIQDLLVPELKAIQVELKYHTEQFQKIDQRFEAVDTRFEALTREMHDRFEALTREMNERFGQLNTRQAVVEGKLDLIIGRLIDHDEVVRLSVRLEHLERAVADLRERGR